MQNNIEKISGNSFIDENHDDLLKHLDELTFFVRDKWDIAKFNNIFYEFILDLENHHAHEEVILRGSKYEETESHTIKHRDLCLFLRLNILKVSCYETAIQFLANSRSKIFSHELVEDQKYWHLFENNDTDTNNIITWSKKYETGHEETDIHHIALANYINRFHRRILKTPDKEMACRELKELTALSQYHYREEELSLGSNLRSSHKSNHILLINELNSLVKEIKEGKYKIENLGDYLKYWLLDHIEKHDIPALKNI